MISSSQRPVGVVRFSTKPWKVHLIINIKVHQSLSESKVLHMSLHMNKAIKVKQMDTHFLYNDHDSPLFLYTRLQSDPPTRSRSRRDKKIRLVWDR